MHGQRSMRKHTFKSDRTYIETMHLFTFSDLYRIWRCCMEHLLQYEKIKLEKIQMQTTIMTIWATKLVSFNALCGKLYTKKGEITTLHFFIKCPIIYLFIVTDPSFISLLVLSINLSWKTYKRSFAQNLSLFESSIGNYSLSVLICQTPFCYQFYLDSPISLRIILIFFCYM